MAGTIIMPKLGRMGRWGNSIFQYAFLRTYARRHNLRYECPAWVGQVLYGHHDPPLTGARLPKIIEKTIHGANDAIIPNLTRPLSNVSCEGYFQYHTSYYRPDETFIRDLFRPAPRIKDALSPALARLRASGSQRIGIHLRRGDQGVKWFYLTPLCWYHDWLLKYWPTFTNPSLFVCSDDREAYKEFLEWRPMTTPQLDAKLPQDLYRGYNHLQYEFTNGVADFYPDHYLLSQCDVILFGATTFGFTAAMLAQSKQHWRSNPRTQQFEQLDPWDSSPLDMTIDVKDFGHIPGIRMTPDDVRKFHGPQAAEILKSWSC